MAPPKSAVAQKLMQDDPTLLPSEDEDDSDFHLSDHGANDNSDSDSSDSDSGGAKRKRQRSPAPPAATAPEPAIDKATVDDLWAQFNNPLDDPYAHQPAKTTSKLEQDDDNDLVTIEVEYEFAGEKLKQKKQVARTSAEAQAYLARNPPPPPSKPATSSSSATSAAPPPPSAPAPSTSKPTNPTTASLDALFGPDSEPSPSTSTSTSESNPPKPEAAAPSLPTAKRRKTGAGKGGGLAGMAAAMGVGGGKPAKLNTLEKSKLDWTSYVSSETGLEDSLAHARKDGYLDRRDFLDRVEGHKSEQFDQARQASRRAGAAAKR